MSTEELRLILFDMYVMDALTPPLIWKQHLDIAERTVDLKQASYSKWAVDELQEYIAKGLYPCECGPIEKFSKLTHEFMMKMAQFAEDAGNNKDMRQIFQIASSVAADILDLLNAMQ